MRVRVGRGSIGNADAVAHLMPITGRTTDKAKCLPPFGHRNASDFRARGLGWLKLEEMERWYPELLHAVPPLAAAAADPSWAKHGRPHPCYWQAPHKACDETARGSRSAPGMTSAHPLNDNLCAEREGGDAVTKYHTTGACAKLHQFFGSDPTVAAAATEFLRADLEVFGYSKWHERVLPPSQPAVRLKG